MSQVGHEEYAPRKPHHDRCQLSRDPSEGNAIEQAYARKLAQLSHLPAQSSLLFFQNCENLASFLNSPYVRTVGINEGSDGESHGHSDQDAWVHFRTYNPESPTPLRSEARTLNELQEVISRIVSYDSGGIIVFLRGYQPPRWLNLLGIRLGLEPEFYRRHLTFSTGTGRAEYCSDASLPSTCAQMTQLTATTLGTRYFQNSRLHRVDQRELKNLRAETSKGMAEYIQQLSRLDGLSGGQGTSMARRFTIHDHKHISLEQNISIFIRHPTQQLKHWIVVAWSDVGKNLGEVTAGPWLSKSLKCNGLPATYWPTVQHLDGVFFSDADSPRVKPQQPRYFREVNIAQTSMSLHEEFDAYLDPQLIAQDPLFGLSGIFNFAASSEAQYLDMLQHLLDQCMDPITLLDSVDDKTLIMWNLVHNKNGLDKRIRNLAQVLQFLDQSRTGNASSFGAMDEVTNHSAQSRLSLLRDFQSLHARAVGLSESYWRSTQMLTNAAMIDESQKAIKQADGITNLTILAFVFIPLTFITSIFDMNLVEFSDRSYVRAWIYVLTALVTLCGTLGVLGWFSYHRELRRLWTRWTRQQKAAIQVSRDVED